MQVSVNETGGQVHPIDVDFLNSLVITDSHDHSIFNGNIANLHTVRENIDYSRVFQYQVRLLQLAGCT